MKRPRAKPKKAAVDLPFKTFTGKGNINYLVFKTPQGSFHVFQEVDAKQAGKRCGGNGANTRQIWASIWDD